MKILIISHEYPPVGGGGANACLNLAHEYAVSGHEVHIVTVWYEGEPDEEMITPDNTGAGRILIRRIHAKRQYVDHSSFPELLDFMVKAYPVCMRLEKEEHFDICHDFFAIPSGPIAYMLKKRFRLPYVIRFGGGDIPGAQKRFALIYKIIAPFEKKVWKSADALVANSDGLKKRAQGFYDGRDIRIIPNGVKPLADGEKASDGSVRETADAELSGSVKAGSPDSDTVRLLFVSRLIEGKGLQDIFPDMRSLSDRCRADGIKLAFDIIGDGPYKSAYEDMVCELGIQDIVFFHGQKNKPELVPFYERADIFVFPSRSEGMPNAVLEAMVYGLPVVMTPCEGSKELIDGNGYVTGADDFPEKIYELISDPDRRMSMGEAGYKRAVREFGWDRAARSYLELFEDIVKK